MELIQRIIRGLLIKSGESVVSLSLQIGGLIRAI